MLPPESTSGDLSLSGGAIATAITAVFAGVGGAYKYIEHQAEKSDKRYAPQLKAFEEMVTYAQRKLVDALNCTDLAEIKRLISDALKDLAKPTRG